MNFSTHHPARQPRPRAHSNASPALSLPRVLSAPLAQRTHRPAFGFSLVELMVAMGLASLVLASVGSMSVYAARSFVAIINYTSLDAKSRYGLDVVSRELRQADTLLSFQTNRSLTFTNARAATTVRLTYDPNARTVVMTKTGQRPLTLLSECDRWAFSLYQRTAAVTGTNISFVPATNTTGALDVNLCKLVSFSWKSSRTIMTEKVNSESVQSAMVVLRNKQ